MIKYYTVPDIPPDLYRKLYRLNEGEISLMRSNLSIDRKCVDYKSFVIVSMTNESVNGWCSVSDGMLQVYVRQSMRGKGFGTRLVNNAKKYLTEEPYVIYNKAQRFFDKVGLE